MRVLLAPGCWGVMMTIDETMRDDIYELASGHPGIRGTLMCVFGC